MWICSSISLRSGRDGESDRSDRRYIMEVQEVAVVIPVYKTEMTDFERISFDQCLKVLHKYPVVLAAPENLDLRNYLCARANLKVIRFDPAFFANIQGYNRLMLSPCFYQAFRDYRY